MISRSSGTKNLTWKSNFFHSFFMKTHKDVLNILRMPHKLHIPMAFYKQQLNMMYLFRFCFISWNSENFLYATFWKQPTAERNGFYACALEMNRWLSDEDGQCFYVRQQRTTSPLPVWKSLFILGRGHSQCLFSAKNTWDCEAHITEVSFAVTAPSAVLQYPEDSLSCHQLIYIAPFSFWWNVRDYFSCQIRLVTIQ